MTGVAWDLAPHPKDAKDSLASYRQRFVLPPDQIYLDGNSMGPPTIASIARLSRALTEEWGAHLVAGWLNDHWMDLPHSVASHLAPLLGVAKGEVIMGDSTTVCLYKVALALARETQGRNVILTDDANFPTDIYCLREVATTMGEGWQLRVVKSDELVTAIDEQVAVVSVTHVNYKTSARYDAAALVKASHSVGAYLLLDLCHSAGAVPLELSSWGVDAAVGCGYKYLNGGPGAPAFMAIANHVMEKLRNPIPGWLGHAAPFEFDLSYRPQEGIGRMVSGSPSVLSLMSLDESVKLFGEVDLDALWRKSQAMSDLFVAIVEDGVGEEVVCATPRDVSGRGSHISWQLKDAWGLVAALKARGIVGDFRAPDIARFAMTPLYTTYAEVERAAREIVDIVRSHEHQSAKWATRPAIT